MTWVSTAQDRKRYEAIGTLLSTASYHFSGRFTAGPGQPGLAHPPGGVAHYVGHEHGLESRHGGRAAPPRAQGMDERSSPRATGRSPASFFGRPDRIDQPCLSEGLHRVDDAVGPGDPDGQGP